MVLSPGGLLLPLHLGGLVSICPPQVPGASCSGPPSHSNGLGGSSQTRKSSSCPLSLLASALQLNTSIPESCPHHPLWSVSRLRDRPQAEASILRFLPVKVYTQGGFDLLGRPGTLSFGVLFEPDPLNLSSSCLCSVLRPGVHLFCS